MSVPTNPPEVYVVAGRRTPQLKAQGKPGPFHASDLAHGAARHLLLGLDLPPDAIDEVILGCVAPGPDEANIARVVALRLGLSERVPAWTVQRNCASGMQAIDSAAQSIRSGRSRIVLAGGTEAMSHHPVLLNELMVAWLAQWNRARSLGQRGRLLTQLSARHLKPIIGLLRGLTDPVVGINMGQTAEELATRFDIDREAMDRYALRSHRRLAQAVEEGVFEDEIVPLYDREGEVYTADDGLRPDTDLDQLARLRPVFDRVGGRVTAGNSAQVSDGAATLLLASAEAVERFDLPVLGRIRDAQWAGLSPRYMGLGPVYAMVPLLHRHDLTTDQVDNWEINEAFAAQVLACLAAWTDPAFCHAELDSEPLPPIDEERLNIHGGGISLGHPVGASGARITLHCLNNLKRSDGRFGIASLCIGGGQGGALLLENVQ